MNTLRTYEVDFDNGHTLICHSLSQARKMVKNNMYNAKVTSIVSCWFDKNSKEKRNKVTF